MYILYAYIPFFNTADTGKIGSNSSANKLRFFIDQQNSVSGISTNQGEDAKLRKCFLQTFIFIIVFCILFLILKNKIKIDFVNGLLSSFAILALPGLWVFNFIFAMQYFYAYPVFLLIVRFLRYILMSIIYIISEKSPSFKASFSDDLVEKLDNFKNYTPTWGLIGGDELKLILNIMGYDNIFSRQIVSNNQNSKDLSDNIHISSGTFSYLFRFIATKETNFAGIIYGFIVLIITLFLSITILYSYIGSSA